MTMRITIGDVALLLFMSAGALLAVRQLPRIWTHRTTFYDVVPRWWPWGGALWRGWVRSLPLGVVLGCALVALFAVGFFLGPPEPGPFGLVAPLWYATAVLLVVFGYVALLCTIALFNWPKAAVPPHLRHEPGALQEWTREHRARRR